MRHIYVFVLFILMIAGSINAVCKYSNNMQISDVGLTTIYPQAGITEHIWFNVHSNELYFGDLDIYLEKSGVKYPLLSDEIYLVKGDNRLEYDFKLSGLLDAGAYMLHIRIGTYDYTMPITISNDDGIEIHGYLPSTPTYDGEYALAMQAYANGTAKASYEVRRGYSNADYGSYDINSENGIIGISKSCNNCRIKLQIAYGDLIAEMDEIFGTYDQPYLRIISFNSDGISLESCASNQYEVYVNGEKIGTRNGIGRINIPLSSGYEELNIALRKSNAGTLIDRSISLSKFPSKNASIKLNIDDDSPFSVSITAYDEYGRRVHSEGLLRIYDEDGNEYVDFISFDGEYKWKENLKDGEYTVEYNRVSAKGNAKAKVFAEEEREINRELTGSDIAPILAAMVALGIIVLIIVWMKRKV